MSERPARLRLRVNPILCDAAGYCAELAPELIRRDEWGYPVIDAQPLDDGELLGLAKRAVAVCPKGALKIEVEDRSR